MIRRFREKVFVVTLILLFVVSAMCFGVAQSEPETDPDGWKELVDTGLFVLSSKIKSGEFPVTAAVIDINKTITFNDSFGKVAILVNLDIYGLDGDDRLELGTKVEDADVRIKIHSTIVKTSDLKENLYFYTGDREWEKIADSSDVVVVLSEQAFVFRVMTWPVDDRIICYGD
jgi:hypothetical protein